MRTLTKVAAVSGNMEESAFRLDENGIEHLMEILSGLYSDPLLAVLREYSANAYDSHIEAGQTRPIEVTLPTRFSPELRIQDYGIGMTAEDIRNTYTVYGTSTKRHTDTQIGGFGIGAKAAFALKTTFSVEAVRDGIVTETIMSTNDKGAPTFSIVSERPTNKPNGVLVRVGVPNTGSSDWQRLSTTAVEFFKYWKLGTVLLDGAAPASVYNDESVDLGDGIVLTNQTADFRTSGVIAVMGQTPYKVDHHSVHNPLPDRKVVILHFNVGDLSISPSREALKYDNATVSKLNGVLQKAREAAKAKIQERVDTETNAARAAKAISDYGSAYGVREWKGQDLTQQVVVTGSLYNRGTYASRFKRYDRQIRLNVGDIANLVVIKDVPQDNTMSMAGIVSDYNTYVEALPRGAQVIVLSKGYTGSSWFLPDETDNPWMTLHYTIVYQKVSDARIANRKARAPREKTKYSYKAPGDRYWSENTPDVIQAAYDAHRAAGGTGELYRVVGQAQGIDVLIDNWKPTDFIVKLKAAHSVEKFEKAMPTAKDLTKDLPAKIKAMWKVFTPEQILAHQMYTSGHWMQSRIRGFRGVFKHLPKALQEVTEIAELNKVQISEVPGIYDVTNMARRHVELTKRDGKTPDKELVAISEAIDTAGTERVESLVNRWPLSQYFLRNDWDRMETAERNHFVLYIATVELSHGTIQTDVLSTIARSVKA